MRFTGVRLSIRLLLVLVLFIGAALGWYVRGIRLQAAAVAAVKEVHGHVGYQWEYKDDQPIYGGKPWAPEWLVRRLGPDAVGSVHSVGLYQRSNDSHLIHVGHFRQVRVLNVIRADITDEGLANLSGVTGLRSLTLSDVPVTDAGLGHVRLDRLRWLILQNTRVTDASLARLEGLTGLEYLDVQGTGITDAGLVHLRGLTGLKELSLENSSVSDAGLAELRGLVGLEKLWLGGSRVTPEGVRALRVSLPNLEVSGVP